MNSRLSNKILYGTSPLLLEGFSSSKVFMSFVGTPGYLSPEMIRQEESTSCMPTYVTSVHLKDPPPPECCRVSDH